MDPQGERERMMEAALRLLSRREHSEKELRRKLRRKGYSDAEFEAVLERLKEWGYLSNDRFAGARARELIRRGYGRAFIRSDLASRGVRLDEEVLDRNFEELGAEEERSALHWLERKTRFLNQAELAAASPEARMKIKRKLVAFLVRKGFKEGLSIRLVDGVLRECCEIHE